MQYNCVTHDFDLAHTINLKLLQIVYRWHIYNL